MEQDLSQMPRVSAEEWERRERQARKAEFGRRAFARELLETIANLPPKNQGVIRRGNLILLDSSPQKL